MKNNEDLQKRVQDAIKWEPLLNAAEIGVTAKDGIVTLTGTVDSYAKKAEAENAAKSVAGVKVVVEKIELRFGSWGQKTDNEIALEVMNAFAWNFEIPKDKLKVTVEDAWVTLDGDVPWNYQRTAVHQAVSKLAGVKGITNNIKIKTESHDTIEKRDIDNAIARNWSINNLDITVEVSGNNVLLTGTVNSWYQRDEAERIAWNAPGVWTIDNQLVIEYDYALAE